MQFDPATWRPQAYAMQFLFQAFKKGYHIFKPRDFSRQAPDSIKELIKFGFLSKAQLSTKDDIVYGAPEGILTPTERGAIFVRENLLKCLQNYALYQLYPVLVKGDLIEVQREIKDKKQVTVSPGIYPIHEVDRYSIALSKDGVLHRLPTYDYKNDLKLVTPLGTIDEEISKRFPLINVKSLMRDLTPIEKSNVHIMKMIGHLYQNSGTKDRMKED